MKNQKSSKRIDGEREAGKQPVTEQKMWQYSELYVAIARM